MCVNVAGLCYLGGICAARVVFTWTPLLVWRVVELMEADTAMPFQAMHV